jgi:hypothetical protein
MSVKLGDNSVITTQGKLNVEVSLNNVKKRVWFAILPLMSSQVVVGMPFFKTFGIVLDLAERRFQMRRSDRSPNAWYSCRDLPPSYTAHALLRQLQVELEVKTKDPIVSIPYELNEDEKKRLDGVLGEFPTVFSEGLGQAQLEPVTIELEEGARPKRQMPYRTTGQKLAQLKEIVEEMVQEGILEKGHSSWASPSFLVKKGDTGK